MSRRVLIRFSCGHIGLASSDLFKEDEILDAECRNCKPSATFRGILITSIFLVIAIITAVFVVVI